MSKFGRGKFNLRWGSIAGVKSSWDMIKKGVKEHFDEKNKKSKTAVENAMIGSSWFKAMKKVPII